MARPTATSFPPTATGPASLASATGSTRNWRVELEGGYRKGDISSIRGASARAQPYALCTANVIRTAAAPACGSPGGYAGCVDPDGQRHL